MIGDLEIVDFRAFAGCKLPLDERVTAVIGSNGAGKTSILESLYLLGHGRSHRVADRRAVIRREQEVSRVVASVSRVGSVENARVALELRRSGELRCSVDRERARTLAEILQLVPVLLIDGDVQGMFVLGAAHRRRLLDWGVFHVEHSFTDTWREYQRVLRQRNAALKDGSAVQARMWDFQLVEFGEQLHRMRATYVARLEVEFAQQVQALLADEASLSYRCGWLGDLGDSLSHAMERDLRLGFTSVGPHRADLIPGVRSTGSNQLSRGQQKLVAIALQLAQVCVHDATPNSSRMSLLVDDASADLDVDNLGKVYSALQSLPAQLVVTAIDERALQRLQVRRMFHVERGTIRLIP